MSTRDLIDAIVSGDSIATQQAFESEMMARVAARMDEKRQEIAQNMFKESVDALDEATDKPAKVGDNHIHVKSAGNGKYKVHAVGKNFADGIKAGEHLSDSELDDFQEMGGKIKHIKEDVEVALEQFTLEELEAFMMSEEFEQLDELSKGTLASYVSKASKDAVRKTKNAAGEHSAGDEDFADGLKALQQGKSADVIKKHTDSGMAHRSAGYKQQAKAGSRLAGVDAASKRLAK